MKVRIFKRDHDNRMKYAVNVVHKTIIEFTALCFITFYNLDFTGPEIAHDSAILPETRTVN